VKFADADLIGLPLRITMGRRGFADGTAELRDRATAETAAVPLDDVVAEVVRRISGMRAALDKPVTIELPAELVAH
jgi:prolyl-tRNA synthetase